MPPLPLSASAADVAAGVSVLVCAVTSADVFVQNIGVEEVVGRGCFGWRLVRDVAAAVARVWSARCRRVAQSPMLSTAGCVVTSCCHLRCSSQNDR
jgi:hypothetical protein